MVEDDEIISRMRSVLITIPFNEMEDLPRRKSEWPMTRMRRIVASHLAYLSSSARQRNTACGLDEAGQ